MKNSSYAAVLVLLLVVGSGACNRNGAEDEATAATPPPAAGSENLDEQTSNRPAEIYFDLTRFEWYRQGRPLVHQGRSYLPQSEPTLVTGELEETGTFEGVTYYREADAAEPVYTLYVPVYYRYWQRFTAPPGM